MRTVVSKQRPLSRLLLLGSPVVLGAVVLVGELRAINRFGSPTEETYLLWIVLTALLAIVVVPALLTPLSVTLMRLD